MADKSIPELEAVHIADLPSLPDLYDEDLLAVSQSGVAKKMTGRQWKAYAVASTEHLADEAKEYADAAKESADNAAESEANAKDYEAQAKADANKAEQYSGKPPIIQDFNWWTWDADAQKYVDTGQPSRGNLMYAAFEIDSSDMNLYMFTDDQYTGPKFGLNDNMELEVILEHA